MREKHELERRVAALQDRSVGHVEEEYVLKLKKELKKTKALLRDTQTMLEKTQSEGGHKLMLRQLKTQVSCRSLLMRFNSECLKIIFFISALCNLYGIIFLSSLKMQSLPRLQLLRLVRVQRVTCLNWEVNWRKLRGLGKRLRTVVQESPRTVLSCRLRSVHIMNSFRFAITLRICFLLKQKQLYLPHEMHSMNCNAHYETLMYLFLISLRRVRRK